MNHEELRDSIPALALHALPSSERQLVETHVSRCAGCSFEYSQYQEIAALLAHLAPAVAPPPTLWRRIEQGLTEDLPQSTTKDLRPSTVIHLSPSTERPRPAGIRGAPGIASPRRLSAQRIVALVAAAVVVIGGAGVALLRSPVFRQQQGHEGGVTKVTYDAIASQPHTVLPLHPTTLAEGVSGEALIAPRGEVGVAIHGLPAPGSGTYTMWLTDDGQTRSLGDFHPDAAGEVRMATADTVGHRPKLAVTLESGRGHTSPTGPPILEVT